MDGFYKNVGNRVKGKVAYPKAPSAAVAYLISPPHTHNIFSSPPAGGFNNWDASSRTFSWQAQQIEWDTAPYFK
jgi:hypothetical protein